MKANFAACRGLSFRRRWRRSNHLAVAPFREEGPQFAPYGSVIISGAMAGSDVGHSALRPARSPQRCSCPCQGESNGSLRQLLRHVPRPAKRSGRPISRCGWKPACQTCGPGFPPTGQGRYRKQNACADAPAIIPDGGRDRRYRKLMPVVVDHEYRVADRVARRG